MRELPITMAAIHNDAFIAALQTALPGKVVGHSTYGTSRPVSVWMDDSATGTDDAVAAGVANAHDPVFVSVDKTSIVANGTDTVTITVKAPKQGAAAVTLTITTTSPGGNVSSQDDAIAMVGGVGTDTITALDPCTIGITVKNGANRSMDTITIAAR